jgi:hypothetical protein
MFPKIDHHHSHLAGKTVDWFCIDTKYVHEENLKNPARRKILEDNNWINTKVEYSFNSHGFRSDEFVPDAPAIMCLGASIVLGTAVPYENTWPFLLQKKHNMLNYNLGISGGSNDTAFRIGSHYIPQLKPNLAIFVNTYTWRLDLITDEKFHTFYDMRHSCPEKYRPYYKEWILTLENGELNYLKNKLALFEICHQEKIPIVEIDGDKIYKMAQHTFGRDTMHPGIEGHEIIAAYIAEQLNW